MAPSLSPVRVLVIADDLLARAGLAALLAGQAGVEVVGQAASGEDIAAGIAGHGAEAAVWDLGWEPSRGLASLGVAAASGPPVLALLPDAVFAAAAWGAGARGLLFRQAGGDRMAAAVAALALGEVVMAPEIAAAIVGATPRRPETHAEDMPAEALSPRELEVLQLLALGLANKEIAARLGVSGHTVKFHVNAILTKLNAASRTEAVIRATRLGLVML